MTEAEAKVFLGGQGWGYTHAYKGRAVRVLALTVQPPDHAKTREALDAFGIEVTVAGNEFIVTDGAKTFDEHRIPYIKTGQSLGV